MYKILKFKDSCVYLSLIFKDLCVYFFLVESNIFETHWCYITSGRRYFICLFPAASGARSIPWELKFSPPYGEDSEARCRLCRRLPESAVLAGSAFAEPKDSRHRRLEKSVGSFLRASSNGRFSRVEEAPSRPKKKGRSLSCLPVEAME